MSVLALCIAFSLYGVLAIVFLSLILSAGRADDADRRSRRAMRRLFRMRRARASHASSHGHPAVGA